MALRDIAVVVKFNNGTVLNVDCATGAEGDKIPTIRIDHGDDLSNQIPPSLIQSVYHWLLHQSILAITTSRKKKPGR